MNARLNALFAHAVIVVVLQVRKFYNKQEFMYMASYLNVPNHDLAHR